MKKWLKIAIIVLIIAAAAIAFWLWKGKNSGSDAKYVFKTETVRRSDISRTISASGTVEPEELINVGAQVNGKIMSFGTDADGKRVDFGSRVKKGMILAQIDDVLYAAELRQCKAQKEQANAAITSAGAAITSAEAAISQADARKQLAVINWERAQKLFAQKAMAASDYDEAKTEWATAIADRAAADAKLKTAQAQLKTAQAQLAIAEAALIKAQRNMDYCVITSPVDGIIIDRRVSIGQTVVSNMSASSIFLIAKDFNQMQIWVSVNEADIGNIRPGQKVEFSVDAYPGTIFYGKVKKIRLNATMSQNVVTYIVEVDADNKNGKLIPYLTANVKFILKEKKDVLNISNAALRFVPNPALVLPESRELMQQELPAKQQLLWVKTPDGMLKPVTVTVGFNAGSRTEIITDSLKDGDEIVFAAVEEKKSTVKSDGTRSPFMPQGPKRTARGAGSAAKRERSEKNAAPAAERK